MESEQVIREKMEKTRESLTEKLETLENKLIGSVEDATTAVRETVTSVKDTMHESVETVKDAFDVKGHIERHPWLMFGGALVGGFALTKLLIPDKRSSSRGFTLTPMLSDTRDYQEPRRSSSTTMTESLMGMLKPELQRLKGLAVGMTLGVVRDFVSKQAPPHLANQLRSIIDGVTKKIGGEPIAPGDMPFADSASSATHAKSDDSRNPGGYS